jgi:hypothetical protein
VSRINQEQIKKTAEFLKQLPKGESGLNFYSYKGKDGVENIFTDMYPSLNHKDAINFFFFACLHQHGFWYGDEKGYVKPLTGSTSGKVEKGSDLLWKIFMKAFVSSPSLFEPKNLAEIEPEELFTKFFAGDYGTIPFPDLEERFKMTRAYGRWFVKYKKSPEEIVMTSNSTKTPLLSFLEKIYFVHGFGKDSLQKKCLLLAMCLANRPEKFLIVKDSRNWLPIIDYHVMRFALRMGLIELNEEDQNANADRLWVNKETEGEIRSNTFVVCNKLIAKSGHTMPFIDEKMWLARKYCPEMETPNCEKCLFELVCKKQIDLFQPVYRTTSY